MCYVIIYWSLWLILIETEYVQVGDTTDHEKKIDISNIDTMASEDDPHAPLKVVDIPWKVLLSINQSTDYCNNYKVISIVTHLYDYH